MAMIEITAEELHTVDARPTMQMGTALGCGQYILAKVMEAGGPVKYENGQYVMTGDISWEQDPARMVFQVVFDSVREEEFNMPAGRLTRRIDTGG